MAPILIQVGCMRNWATGNRGLSPFLIILPHGVLFRGGAEERIRTKLLKDGHVDTVIGLPANLFFSTGIPVCILVLKKCKKPDDVLFINAAEHFEKASGKTACYRSTSTRSSTPTSSAAKKSATSVACRLKRLKPMATT